MVKHNNMRHPHKKLKITKKNKFRRTTGGFDDFENKIIDLMRKGQSNTKELIEQIPPKRETVIMDEIEKATPLMWACNKGMEPVALKLIENNYYYPKAIDYGILRDESTELMWACSKGMKEVALKLIETGLYRLDAENIIHVTALIMACSKGVEMEEVALEIIKQGNFNPDAKEYYSKSNALILACSKGMNKVALKLIETGLFNMADVNIHDNTALVYACAKEMEEVALKIIEKGNYNPSATDKLGNTALIYACEKGMEDVALKIIETKDSNPNAVNENVESALDIACNKNLEKVSVEIMKELNRMNGTEISSCETIPFKYTDGNTNTETNNYIVHYQRYNNVDYPIVSILKGSLLYSCRDLKRSQQRHLSKFHYLNKLDKSYDETNFENARTYFYPLPYYGKVVSNSFNTIDMVALTEDMRLLCMVSPSPLSRGHRHSKKNGLTTCEEKTFDLCISDDVMKGLNIQGYIGIAKGDSINEHHDTFNNLLAVYPMLDKVVKSIYSRCCVDKVFEKKPILGIPEICIIPFLFNQYSKEDYIEQQTVFNLNLNNESEPDTQETIDEIQTLIHENKKYYSFYTIESITGYNLIEACNKLCEKMKTKPNNYGQSLQSPMFTVYLPELKNETKNPAILDKTLSIDEFTLDMVDYKKAYQPKPESYSAFETDLYRKLRQKEQKGGRTLAPSAPSTPSFITEPKYTFKNKNKKSTEENRFFAGIANNIPFLIIDTKKDKKGGSTKKQNKLMNRKTHKKTPVM